MGYPVIHIPNIHDNVGAREAIRSLKDKYLTEIQNPILKTRNYQFSIINFQILYYLLASNPIKQIIST